jgi:hypothetical protein
MMMLFGLCLIIWGIKGAIQAYEQNELRKNNPDVWMRQQELEQRERLSKREGVKSFATLGFQIARLFMGK